MAWSSSDLTAQEIADKADDLPIFLSTNGLLDARDGLAFQWSTTTAADFGDAADDDTNFPLDRCGDGFHHLVSKPTTAGTTFTAMFNLGTTTATFDTIMIGGHNFGTLGSSTVTVDIADDSTFTTNLETLATFGSITTDKRLVELDLSHTADPAPNRYTGVQYIRVNITLGTSGLPEIGELLLSRRRQMQNGQLLPYDDEMAMSRISDFPARSGVTSRYVFHKGKALRNATFMTENSTQAQIIKDFWSDTQFGTRSFGYMECPESDEQDVLIMLMRTPQLRFPFSSDKVRRVSINMVEQPPFLSSES